MHLKVNQISIKSRRCVFLNQKSKACVCSAEDGVIHMSGKTAQFHQLLWFGLNKNSRKHNVIAVFVVIHRYKQQDGAV